jgi:hypothetical protein
MLPKHIITEVKRLENNISIRKNRIAKLKRMAKLSKNEDIISEYDEIIKQSTNTIDAILESKEILDATKEQVILHGAAKMRLMAKGLKSSLLESERQIEYLNNCIEDDNIKISKLQKENKTSVGGII